MEVQANSDINIEIKADWINQSITKTLSNTTLSFVIERNLSGKKREGEIVLTNGSLTEKIVVYQEFKDIVVLTTNQYTLPEEGGIVDVEIKSSVDYDVKILSGTEWVSEVETIGPYLRKYYSFQ